MTNNPPVYQIVVDEMEDVETLQINGKYVTSSSRDEVGSSVQDAMARVFEACARETGAKFERVYP